MSDGRPPLNMGAVSPTRQVAETAESRRPWAMGRGRRLSRQTGQDALHLNRGPLLSAAGGRDATFGQSPGEAGPSGRRDEPLNEACADAERATDLEDAHAIGPQSLHLGG
jgi:hypothetical protein